MKTPHQILSEVNARYSLAAEDEIVRAMELYAEEVRNYDNENRISLLRDCVSETWGAKTFNEVQQKFDEFLKRRKLA